MNDNNNINVTPLVVLLIIAAIVMIAAAVFASPAIAIMSLCGTSC